MGLPAAVGSLRPHFPSGSATTSNSLLLDEGLLAWLSDQPPYRPLNLELAIADINRTPEDAESIWAAADEFDIDCQLHGPTSIVDEMLASV